MADSMTLEEALAASETSESTSSLLCVIDPDTRKINIPDARKLLGVESDEGVERIYFKCPAVVGDGIDLSALALRVNFRNADGDLDMYVVEDMESDGTYITFSWVLGRKVTMYKGTVGFVVCAVSVQDDGTVKNEWNTALNTDCYVLEGLEVTEDVIGESDPEVVEWIVAHFEEVINAAAEAEDTKAVLEEATGDAENAKADLDASSESASKAKDTLDESIKTAQSLVEALPDYGFSVVDGALNVTFAE